MDRTQEMLTTFNDHSDLLEKVITGDESQAYGHDIETNAQSSQWKRPEEPRPPYCQKSAEEIFEKHFMAIFIYSQSFC